MVVFDEWVRDQLYEKNDLLRKHVNAQIIKLLKTKLFDAGAPPPTLTSKEITPQCLISVYPAPMGRT